MSHTKGMPVRQRVRHERRDGAAADRCVAGSRTGEVASYAAVLASDGVAFAYDTPRDPHQFTTLNDLV